MNLSLLKKVSPGFILPRFYGVAHVDWRTGDAVCLPIPFNVIVFWSIETWYWLKRGGRSVKFGAAAAYAQGRHDEREAFANNRT